MIMQLRSPSGCRRCGVTGYSAIYKAFSPQSLSGMGALTMEQASEIAMYGASRGYTDEQIKEAVAVLYPATDSEGRLVSAERLESGEYTLSDSSGVAVRTGDGGTTTMTVPPKPVDQPPAYYPMEQCNPGDSACVSRNSARQSANMVIEDNADAAFNAAMCRHNAARNNDQARYDQCASMFPQQLVPYAPNGLAPAVGTPGSGFHPQAGVPGTIPLAEAIPSYGDEPRVIDVTPTEVEVIPGTQPDSGLPGRQPGVVDVAQPPSILESILGPVEEFAGDIGEKTGLSTTTLLIIAGAGLFLLIKK